jgi:acetyltransferase-like isoleucine patch superfamily enzyme
MKSIGTDVCIDKFVRITRPNLVEIGNHVAIDFGFTCTTQLKVGDYVHISPHVSVIGGEQGRLEIDDFCFISTGARVICSSEKFMGDGLVGPFIPKEYRDTVLKGTVKFERFSGMCANSIIMPGVTMAEGSVLGANSFLKESTEPWGIYAGSPARLIKKRRSDIIYNNAKEMGYVYE